MYIGPQTRNARKPPFPLAPANISPLPGGGGGRGGLYLEIALKYKVKQSKNGKFRSN